MELILSNENFDDFVGARFISSNFLQSSIWQDFLSAQKKNFWQLAITDNGKLIATCLLYENRLPYGKSYLYAPKGPIISDEISVEQKKGAVELILSKVRDVTVETKKYQEIFFKLEPETESSLVSELKKSPDIHPRDTLVLDIEPDEKNLLGQMHQKTRYNIALARRRDVEIKFGGTNEDLDDFLQLTKKTAERNQITVHRDDYYRLLWQTLKNRDAGEIVLAKVKDKTVAANIVVRFGEAMTYLHGASDYEMRNYMAPHLLQWETIKQAKRLGYKIYDFWGIAPSDGSKPKWEGISRFKRGFGGREIESPGTYEMVYDQNWYRIYKIAKKIFR
ncbi:peptidoglycan bridge formation glycyltransferase FemA/FemB family protein [Candidatus Parcubacteria bacterium]|nr:MAG: peptidoglycan bridge formation glycyltransferase FemA/FemB family protein [Candidatus Parcubacteria bacterium]